MTGDSAPFQRPGTAKLQVFEGHGHGGLSGRAPQAAGPGVFEYSCTAPLARCPAKPGGRIANADARAGAPDAPWHGRSSYWLEAVR